MVLNNHTDMRSLYLKKKIKSPLSQNPWRRLTKLGHPADCNSKKRNSSGKKKKGITKIRQERGLTNPQQKRNDCLFKISYQHLNHHRKIRAKTQTRSNMMISTGESRTWEAHAGGVRLRIYNLMGSTSGERYFAEVLMITPLGIPLISYVGEFDELRRGRSFRCN